MFGIGKQEAGAFAFMLKQFLKSTPIKEQSVPDEYLAAELSALQDRLKVNGEELRRITEPKSGFVAYYVVKKGSENLTGVLNAGSTR